jgi:hypothetical protein
MCKTHDPLIELLKYGSFGGLSLGMTPIEVVKKHGIGDTSLSPRGVNQDTPYIIYDRNVLQLIFDCGRLWMIQIDFLGHVVSIPESVISGWTFSRKLLHYEGFIAFLDFNGITWSIYSGLTFDDQVAIQTESGAIAIFSPKVLFSIGLCAATREIKNAGMDRKKG